MSTKTENLPKTGNSNKQSLVALAKSVLIEQNQRLSHKNNIEIDLLEDFYRYLKSRCQIEAQYNQQMIKLSTYHLNKKHPSLRTDPNSESKALYPAWIGYLGQTERCSKDRLAHFSQIQNVVDQIKNMKTHKQQLVKKTMDNYFKKSQDDVLSSLSEIDKCRKLYFNEEHYANQARDKEEKIKKRKYNILLKFTDMQSKKEKSSAQREASDIQSTQARNEYILALAAGNAHLKHYFEVELSYLLEILEDNTINNCKDILLQLVDKESKCQESSASALRECLDYLNKVTASYTNTAFLNDFSNTSLNERLQIEFEPCENDTIREVSIEHNAAIALESEITKWTTCFTKETRNLVKIDQQLIKCYQMQSSGKKTVEVSGIGQMDLDQRIEDLKLQKRKCDLNKCKAKARLVALQKGGLAIDDLDLIEENISKELNEQFEKQQKDKQMLTVNANDSDVLSRTSSLRSTNVSPDLGRISVMENKSQSEDRQEFNDTPEPLSSENDFSEDQAQQYNAKWNDYDVNAMWADSSDPVQEETYNQTTTNYSEEQFQYDNQNDVSDQQAFVGKNVQAIYSYIAQNEDELDIEEYDQLLIISADEKDWLKARNSQNKEGFIPLAYVELLDQQTQNISSNIDNSATADINSNQQNLLSNQESYSEAKYIEKQQPYQENETQEYKENNYQENNYQETNYQETNYHESSYNESSYTTSDAFSNKANNLEADGKIYATAVYDYEATSAEEISFNEGDLILILEKSDDGWWFGEINGQKGHFPSMLVHGDDDNDDEEDNEDEEENDENQQNDNEEETPDDYQNENIISKFKPPPLPPRMDIIENENDSKEPNSSTNELTSSKLSAPHVVFIEPTPEIEHKPIVEEKNFNEETINNDEEIIDNKEEIIKNENNEIKKLEEETEKIEDVKYDNNETEERMIDNSVKLKENFGSNTVEINVYESEKQVFSSDEEDVPEPAPANPPIEVIVKQEPEIEDIEDLPPPPPELTAPSEEEAEEDEQLILKRLKQLKDTNNNFTASFDILDDSELTTAENSEENLTEIKENEGSKEESKNNENTKEEPKKVEELKNNFADFESNFPIEEEDLK